MKLNMDIKLNLNESSDDEIKKAELILFQCMAKMEELAKMKVAVDTGRLKNSITLNPTYPGARRYVLSDGVEYGIDIEYGTSPHIVPLAPLQGWAGRVLGNKSLGAAVKSKIAMKGTQAQPFMRPAYHEVASYWLGVFSKDVYG